MKTRIPLWILLLAVVTAFGLGGYAGFHYGWSIQKYLQARHDLGARIYYARNTSSMVRNNGSEILGETLLLADCPRWMGVLEHRDGLLAPGIIQDRKDTIAEILKKQGGPLVGPDADKIAGEVVDGHLSHPDLYIP